MFKKLFGLLVLAFCISWNVYAQALYDKPVFQEDAKLEKYVAEDAKRAIDHAEKTLSIKLDGSEKSIEQVELSLNVLHKLYAEADPKPDERQIESVAYAYGSYIGEIYRKHHGGKWGMINWQNQKFPGIMTPNGSMFWPWSRALKRVKEGAEENVVSYYELQVRKGKDKLEEKPKKAVKKKVISGK